MKTANSRLATRGRSDWTYHAIVDGESPAAQCQAGVRLGGWLADVADFPLLIRRRFRNRFGHRARFSWRAYAGGKCRRLQPESAAANADDDIALSVLDTTSLSLALWSSIFLFS